MASRSRRTQFAASFVAVVAAGCAHEQAGTGTGTGTGSQTASGTGTGSAERGYAASWSVNKGTDGACWAEPHVDCPPPGPLSHTCNPPAPMRMPCPADAGDSFQVVSFDNKTCFLADGKTAVTCPSYDMPAPTPDAAPAAAFVPQAWRITQSGKDCYAELTSMSACPEGASCNPPPPERVACADYEVGAEIHQRAAGECVVYAAPMHCPKHAHCNPPPPRDVKCP